MPVGLRDGYVEVSNIINVQGSLVVTHLTPLDELPVVWVNSAKTLHGQKKDQFQGRDSFMVQYRPAFQR
jgi:hypothetical protein